MDAECVVGCGCGGGSEGSLIGRPVGGWTYDAWCIGFELSNLGREDTEWIGRFYSVVTFVCSFVFLWFFFSFYFGFFDHHYLSVVNRRVREHPLVYSFFLPHFLSLPASGKQYTSYPIHYLLSFFNTIQHYLTLLSRFVIQRCIHHVHLFFSRFLLIALTPQMFGVPIRLNHMHTSLILLESHPPVLIHTTPWHLGSTTQMHFHIPV